MTAHNLALQSELLQLHGTLSEAGVEAVVLKGLPLMRRLGEDIAGRRLADNDILVRKADIERAEAACRDLGYMPVPGRELPVSLRSESGQHPLVREVAGHRVCVELHWEAFHPPFTGVDPDLLWRHTETTAFQGAELRVFDAPLTLVHTAAHFVWHAMNETRLLRTLGRAWDAWGAGIRATDLESLARRTGTFHALTYSLSAARDLGFSRDVPQFQSTRARALGRLLPPHRLGEPRPHPDYDRILLSLMLVSPSRGAAHLRRLMLPAPAQVGVVAGDSSVRGVATHYLGRPARTLRRFLAYRAKRRA